MTASGSRHQTVILLWWQVDHCAWLKKVFAGDQPGYWSNPDCIVQRGWFERGMLCAVPVSDVVWTNRPAECSNTTAAVCEPVLEYLDIHLSTDTAGASIYYRSDSPDSPVTPVVTSPSSTAESVPNLGSRLLGPDGIIRLEVGRAGCNVFSIASRIRTVAVLQGRPNSNDLDLGPSFLVTPLGYWPPPVANKSTIPYCPIAAWLPDPVAMSMPVPWLSDPPSSAFGGCMAYRFLTFHPTALFSSETDAWALSSIEFYFRCVGPFPSRWVISVADLSHDRGAKVQGVYPLRKNSTTWIFSSGFYPTSQGPSSLASSSKYAKFLALDGCPLHLDFGKRVNLLGPNSAPVPGVNRFLSGRFSSIVTGFELQRTAILETLRGGEYWAARTSTIGHCWTIQARGRLIFSTLQEPGRLCSQ